MTDLAAIGRVTLVGGGNMGGAMLDGWLAQGLPGRCVELVDPGASDTKRREWEEQGVRVLTAAEETAPDLLVIAVKPQIIDAVLQAVASIVGSKTVVVSVAAGVTLSRLRAALGADAKCVRAMPNTPSQVSRGVTVCCGTDDVTEGEAGRVTDLMQAVGIVEWVDDEALMDAVTGVSGSGPAYVFHLAEALAQAGRDAGLPAELAARIATATVSGAGELMHRSEDTPEALRKAVTSPNGTTQAGLEVLMNELPNLMARTVAAAAERSKELA